MPPSIRDSIFTTLTHRLGIQGDALVTAKQAFASSDDIRRATGFLGLVLTFFFASSFTTALQRVYLRAWRRPPGNKAGDYARGPAWFLAVLAFMALLGGLRGLVGDGAAARRVRGPVARGDVGAVVVHRVVHADGPGAMAGAASPPAWITGVAMAGYALSATIWMPNVVTRNQSQFGFFGVALALVTWFSGAAICILVGACAGPVFAADTGRVGEFVRGRETSPLTVGAEASLPAPEIGPRLRDAFRNSRR